MGCWGIFAIDVWHCWLGFKKGLRNSLFIIIIIIIIIILPVVINNIK